ncbi:MAG: hypothetical protein JW857_03050 [Bacteroidales bacterium]|nr:hypothetical protein [Bacteroidales bacterium]
MVNNPISLYKEELKQAEFELISKYVNKNFGIKLPDHKRIMLQGRLINRLIKLNLPNFKAYTDYAFSEQGRISELPLMIDYISTNKTDFFRESVHFDILKEKCIPCFLENSNTKQMQIWSAGCSSGEEAYTIAMTCADEEKSKLNFDYTILATDVSLRMLEKGKNAIYPLKDIESFSEETKKKYLLKSKDKEKSEVRIKKALRDKVRFQWHNLMDQEYKIHQEFDIIFCRNVLIYFSKEDQLHVLTNLYKNLKTGGFLFLGHSESINHFNLPLINIGQTVFQKL